MSRHSWASVGEGDPSAVDGALAGCCQGDIVGLTDLFHLAAPAPARQPLLGRLRVAPTWLRKGRSPAIHAPAWVQAEGAVVITQTCDVARSCVERPFVQVAPLVRFVDPQEATLLAGGASPRFVAVPRAGTNAFVDLDLVMTVTKERLAGCERYPGVVGDEEIRQFGQSVARKFGRYPFPDAFARSVRRLRGRVLDKWNKPDSAEGRALELISQIRAHAEPSWDADGVSVELTFIARPGTIPTLLDPPSPSDELRAWWGPGRGPAQVAERLLGAATPDDQAWCWARLGDAWAACCDPEENITSITGEVLGADEYSIDRYWSSEPLDLDYLSGPENA